MAKKEEEIEKILSGIDFRNLTTEEITGPNGLLKPIYQETIRASNECRNDKSSWL